MQIIDTQKKLDESLCEINASTIIGVDTEFIRADTFWPKLCIIQISTKSNYYLIDALLNLNYVGLWEALANESITKVIHSSRQDIEAIFYISKKIPYPIFDTQLAAMFTGFRESISYSQIVEDVFQIKLDKKLQYSDWSSRPIDREMFDYAKDDVRYLIPIFEYLSVKLDSQSKTEWFLEETESLHKVSIKLSEKMTKPIHAIGQEIREGHDPLSSVREFRDEIASCYNIPRKNVLSDSDLIEMLQINIDNIDDLKNHLKENKLFTGNLDLLSKLWRFIDAIGNNKSIKHDKKMLSKNQKLTLKSLNKVLENSANKYNICPHIIATQSDLKAYINKGNDYTKFITGWRNSAFGKDADAILNEL